MKDFQSRQKLKKFLYSPWILLVLALITGLLIKGAIGILNKERDSAQTLAELEENNVKLRDRHQELEAEIASLQTEQGVMQEIRAKFNAAREGEHLAVIVDEEGKGTSEEDSSLPWYQKLWNAIMQSL